MDCIWLAFYFLLQPSEFANDTKDAKHPFCLKDVQFKMGALHIFDAHLALPTQQLSATIVSLTFSTQKNGVKVEKISHATNGQLFACPVHAALWHILHLNSHQASPNTPLHVFFDNGSKCTVTSAMTTSLLHAAALSIPGHAGINPSNIGACSVPLEPCPSA